MKQFLLGVFLGVTITFMIWAAAFSDFRDSYRSKVVELGAAEWVIDQKTGKTTFNWKEKP